MIYPIRQNTTNRNKEYLWYEHDTDNGSTLSESQHNNIYTSSNRGDSLLKTSRQSALLSSSTFFKTSRQLSPLTRHRRALSAAIKPSATTTAPHNAYNHIASSNILSSTPDSGLNHNVIRSYRHKEPSPRYISPQKWAENIVYQKGEDGFPLSSLASPGSRITTMSVSSFKSIAQKDINASCSLSTPKLYIQPQTTELKTPQTPYSPKEFKIMKQGQSCIRRQQQQQQQQVLENNLLLEQSIPRDKKQPISSFLRSASYTRPLKNSSYCLNENDDRLQEQQQQQKEEDCIVHLKSKQQQQQHTKNFTSTTQIHSEILPSMAVTAYNQQSYQPCDSLKDILNLPSNLQELALNILQQQQKIRILELKLNLNQLRNENLSYQNSTSSDSLLDNSHLLSSYHRRILQSSANKKTFKNKTRQENREEKERQHAKISVTIKEKKTAAASSMHNAIKESIQAKVEQQKETIFKSDPLSKIQNISEQLSSNKESFSKTSVSSSSSSSSSDFDSTLPSCLPREQSQQQENTQQQQQQQQEQQQQQQQETRQNDQQHQFSSLYPKPEKLHPSKLLGIPGTISLEEIQSINRKNLALAQNQHTATSFIQNIHQDEGSVIDVEKFKAALLTLNPQFKDSPDMLITAITAHMNGKSIPPLASSTLLTSMNENNNNNLNNEDKNDILCSNNSLQQQSVSLCDTTTTLSSFPPPPPPPPSGKYIHEGFKNVCHAQTHNLQIEQIDEITQETLTRNIPVIQVYKCPPVYVITDFLNQQECKLILRLTEFHWEKSNLLPNIAKLPKGKNETIDRILRRAATALQVDMDDIDCALLNRLLQEDDNYETTNVNTNKISEILLPLKYRSTLFVFLNEIKEGGELDLIHLGFQVRSQVGMALLWHNVSVTTDPITNKIQFDHKQHESRMLHSVLPPKGTEKQFLLLIHVKNPECNNGSGGGGF